MAPIDAPCFPIGSPSQASLGATLPGVSPIGSGVSPDSYQADTPTGHSPQIGPGVVIHPRRLVAPVGREVVLVGGIQSQPDVFRSGEQVQWSLSQDSAGTIVDADGQYSGRRRVLEMFGRKPRRSGGDLIESRTAKNCDLLRRNPVDPQDDVYVSRGQTWVSLTSGSEGVSYVTLAAPQLSQWSRRQQTASIIWVDGQWSFPPPTFSSQSSPGQLVTYVTRQSDSQPISGWIVRYSIMDGPPAAMDLDGSPVIDVFTDTQGRAVANVYPQGVELGTTRVGVQIIKPQTHPGEPRQMLIGEGQTSVTWTGSDGVTSVVPPVESPAVPFAADPQGQPATEPPLDTSPAPTPVSQSTSLSIVVSGPATARSGEEITYGITVRNIGTMTAEDVLVSTSLPESGLQFLGSIPRAISDTRQVDWRLGHLRPNESSVISARFRATDGRRLHNVFYAHAANADAVNHGQTTNVTREILLVSVSDPIPNQVQVGQDVTFNVTVINQGDVPLDVELVDDFDPGLEPLVDGPPAKAIQRGPFRLPPGPSDPIPLTFRARAVGTHEHRVVVSEPGGARAQAIGSVRVTAARRSEVSVDVRGPPRLAAGSTGEILVTVQNTGDTVLTDTQVEYRFEQDLIVTNATDGHLASTTDPVLVWSVGDEARRMLPNTAVKIRLIVQASSAPSQQRACNSVVVTSSEGAREAREFCIDIDRPTTPGAVPPDLGANGGIRQPSASGTLEARAESRSATARVNEPIEYVITLRNNNAQSYRAIVVTLQIAPGMQFTRDATGPPGTQPVPGADPLVLQFSPLGEMRPGDELTYGAVVVPRGTGTATLLARIDAVGLSRTVVVQAQTPVN